MNTNKGLEMHHLMFIFEKKSGPNATPIELLERFDIFLIVPQQYVTCWLKYGIPHDHINEL